jgi:hypothetical protein
LWRALATCLPLAYDRAMPRGSKGEKRAVDYCVGGATRWPYSRLAVSFLFALFIGMVGAFLGEKIPGQENIKILGNENIGNVIGVYVGVMLGLYGAKYFWARWDRGESSPPHSS